MHISIKKVLFLISLSSFFLLFGCSSQDVSETNLSKGYTDIIEVTTGSLGGNKTYVGHVQPFKHAILSAKTPGRVTEIFYEKADFVTTGDLIASLDGMEAKTSYQSSQYMLSALSNMKRSTSDMLDAQIQAMESKVAQVKLGLDASSLGIGANDEKLTLATQEVNQAKLASDASLIQLQETQKKLEQQEMSIYSNAQNALSQSKILMQNIGLFIDELFGISLANRNKNDDFDIYLGAKNSANKTKVKSTWRTLQSTYMSHESDINKVLEMEGLFTSLDQSQKDFIYSTLQQVESFLGEVRILLDLVDSVLNDSVSASSFTQTTIDTYKQQNLSYQNQLEQILLKAEGNFLLGIKGSRQSIDSFEKESVATLTSLKKQLELADSSFSVAKEAKGISHQTSQQQYQEIQANLEALKSQKSTQLAEIDTEIAQLMGNKNMAAVQIENTQIVAPFDGVIIDKMVNMGEVVNPGVPLFEVGTIDKLKLYVQIPQQLLASVSVGDKVSVAVPVLEHTTTGQIYKIAPMADPQTKNIEIQIVLDNPDQFIKLGMYANVAFEQKKIQGVLVPEKFIFYDFGEAYIKTLQDDGSIEKQIVGVSLCEQEHCLVTDYDLLNQQIVR